MTIAARGTGETGDFEQSPDTNRLLQTVESTSDEALRHEAIAGLAQTKDPAAGRVLIEIFGRSMWRETKLAVLRALGIMGLPRTTAFLVRQAGDRSDLAMAGEAILALGATADPLAGEFLLSILGERDHPLHREAIIGLSQLATFPCDLELDAMFDRTEAEVSPALRQYLILAIGRRGPVGAWERVRRHFGSGESTVIFNAALIAAGMVGGKAAHETLTGLDTRYRFFADHLKQLALERIALQARRAVEDGVAAALDATDAPGLLQALSLLRQFPVDKAWEAFRILEAGVSRVTEVAVRATLFLPSRLEADLDFLAAHWDEVSTSATSWVAALVRQHLRHGAELQPVATLAARLPVVAVAALLTSVRHEGAFAWLATQIADADLPNETRVVAVNAVVAQAKMSLPGSREALEAATLLLELLKSCASPELKARILRALGEVRHESGSFLISLAAMLKDEDSDNASIYATLAEVASADAARVILKRLSKVMSRASAVPEIRRAFAALARIGKLPEGELVPLAPEPLWPELTASILALLALQGQDGYRPLITAGLGAVDFQLRLMAIAAAKHTSSPEILASLLATLDDPSPSLSGRAVDSLCASGDLPAFRRLLAWTREPGRDTRSVLKVLRSLRPGEADCGPLIADLDAMLQENAPFLRDQEARTAAVNLRDNLQLMRGRRLGRGAAVVPSPADTGEHSLDAQLAQLIVGYPRFSETVKTVLRNAEVTFKHADLFDDRVDKSTMVVEYVKSIDILLQERIGAAIFLDPHSQLLRLMQSRIVQLSLDDETLPVPQLIKDLQCGMHFTVENFPAHKLALVSKSITSGRFQRDQYATIDGLRAWALLLLIFGRQFRFRQKPIEPLFTLADASNQLVSELAVEMNSLQELRNHAAHRATLLRSAKLVELREISFKVLNGLTRALGN